MRGDSRDFNTGSAVVGGRAVPLEVGGPSGYLVCFGGEFNYNDLVQSFINTVRTSSPPFGFFRGIRREGDFVNPLIFAIICYEVQRSWACSV